MVRENDLPLCASGGDWADVAQTSPAPTPGAPDGELDDLPPLEEAHAHDPQQAHGPEPRQQYFLWYLHNLQFRKQINYHLNHTWNNLWTILSAHVYPNLQARYVFDFLAKCYTYM